METFIEKSDYPQSVHTEILDALIRNDETILDLVEDRNIGLAKGYIEGRYDADAMFAARGAERNKVLLGVCLDLVLYDIFSIHNPQKMSQIRKDRYDRAVEWLKAVQKGNVTISGAPRLTEAETNDSFRIVSNRKRDNHY